MNLHRLIAPVALCAVLAGCAGAVTSEQPSTPLASAAVRGIDPATPAGSSVPAAPATAAPTPDPEVVRKAAAAAYLSAAEKGNKARKALNKKYKTFKTLKQARAYYKASAKIEGSFIAAVKALKVPADTAGDLHTMVAKWAAVQALEVEASGVKSWSHQESVDAAIVKAERIASGASNLIRADLGLPPVHN